MTEPSHAVFLSYASQDAETARRIADTLRAAGIEVWFDQSELRGGDVWDQKIRHQIRECALFLPIISSHTQERTEGYFRLEWRLADQRTHLMGRTRPFIVPVCVDDTPETDADVPDAFCAVQWMRLHNGTRDRPSSSASCGCCRPKRERSGRQSPPQRHPLGLHPDCLRRVLPRRDQCSVS